METNINDLKIVIPTSVEEITAYYNLRFEILRKPWGQDTKTTRDEWEDQSFHLMLMDSDKKTIATGRLQFISEDICQVRSMAVETTNQRRGIGTHLLKLLEDKAKELKYKRIVLDAREQAVGFYEKNGYSVDGDSYILFGVIPHFHMYKDI